MFRLPILTLRVVLTLFNTLFAQALRALCTQAECKLATSVGARWVERPFSTAKKKDVA